ncbi:hypothetical protein like AT4G33800 [Hibiscus trionum]|uniref:Uncharacterized protein n=1 Tax=Hibiscus trionum TaxID=183268 RepID=A0A9W7MWS2_HIBTR|nr:hypothetical protein like AT4G33800 [Hibiscus trionum]
MEAFGFASECNNNSGYESGWTHYLDHSFISSNPTSEGEKEDDVEEEDDLSMVSDASSGPPHADNGIDDDRCRYSVPKLAALDKNGADELREQGSLLDDTATSWSSSPVMDFSKEIIAETYDQASMETFFDYQQGFSATHFKEGPAFHEQFPFNWKFQN